MGPAIIYSGATFVDPFELEVIDGDGKPVISKTVSVEDDFKDAVNNANLFYVIDTVIESGDYKVAISAEELQAVFDSGIPTYLRIEDIIVPAGHNQGEYSRIIYDKTDNCFFCGIWTINPETMMVEFEEVTINLPSQS